MKIDTNCDGTVDWDEFCTYMLLEYQEKDSMNRGKRLPYPHPLKMVGSPHHELLSNISYMPTVQLESDHGFLATKKECGRYLSVSKDGTVCLWKSDLFLSRTIKVSATTPC